jgi:hypothetical protein
MASSRRLPTSYNEKTYGSAGGRDYTALATWEADTDTDLVTATKGEVLTCYADSATYSDSNVDIAGATTNSSYFRVIRAASGKRGTRTSGVRFEYSSASPSFIFILNENYSRAHDIGVKVTYTGNNKTTGSQGILLNASPSICIGCTVYDVTSDGLNGIMAGISAVGGTSYIINCYVYNTTGGGSWGGYSGGIRINGKGVKSYAYNCTVTNCGNNGFRADNSGGGGIAKNCISVNNGTNFKTGEGTDAWTQTTCATSGVTFAADGYHLASNDTGAINAGTDLSADGTFAFDDDIDGETRDDWDIGCDEYVAAATAKPYYYFMNQ